PGEMLTGISPLFYFPLPTHQHISAYIPTQAPTAGAVEVRKVEYTKDDKTIKTCAPVFAEGEDAAYEAARKNAEEKELKKDQAWRAFWVSLLGNPSEEYTVGVTDPDEIKSPEDMWKVVDDAEAGKRGKNSADVDSLKSQISQLEDYLSIWAKEGSESAWSILTSRLKAPDDQQTISIYMPGIDYTLTIRYPLAKNDPLPDNAEDYIKLLDRYQEEATPQQLEMHKRYVAMTESAARASSAQELAGRSAENIVASQKAVFDALEDDLEASIELLREFAKLYYANRDEVARKCASLGDYENSWSMPKPVAENAPEPDENQQSEAPKDDVSTPSPAATPQKKGIIAAAATFVQRMAQRILAAIIHVFIWIF
ncbi:MAG: hypothetical protein Q3972_08580, partial [Corynebacterium sp.]|nr:hypothetical protein [Corynebacterium sp.]